MTNIISASQIQTFMYCPRAYEYAYVYKKRGSESRALRLGVLFHKRIADFLRSKTDKVKIPSPWRPAFQAVVDQLSNNLLIEHTMKGEVFNHDTIGIVDVLDIDNRKIIDWKFSKNPRPYTAQAFLYKALVKQLYNIDCDVVFAYLPANAQIVAQATDIDIGRQHTLRFLIGRECKHNKYKFNINNPKCLACSYNFYCMMDTGNGHNMNL